MTDTYDPPTPNAALVVGPDDQLIVQLPDGTPPEQCEALRDALRERFGDRASIIVGIEAMAVLHATDREGTTQL